MEYFKNDASNTSENDMTSFRHIEWPANLGIVVAKRLTSPLFVGCIEMYNESFILTFYK